jgi:hypothetical protein
MWSTRYSYTILMKIYLNSLSKNSWQISWKSDQLELFCSMWTDGRTDGRGWANRRFSQFCERAWSWSQKEDKLEGLRYGWKNDALSVTGCYLTKLMISLQNDK